MAAKKPQTGSLYFNSDNLFSKKYALIYTSINPVSVYVLDTLREKKDTRYFNRFDVMGILLKELAQNLLNIMLRHQIIGLLVQYNNPVCLFEV